MAEKNKVFFQPSSNPPPERNRVPERSLVEPLGEARRSRRVVQSVARTLLKKNDQGSLSVGSEATRVEGQLPTVAGTPNLNTPP